MDCTELNWTGLDLNMKRRHTGYIVVALLLTTCSQLVVYTSLVSEHWVVVRSPHNCCRNVSRIDIGLFEASLTQVLQNSTEKRSNLGLVCLFNLNVCAWSCQSQEPHTREEIANLYERGMPPTSCIANDSQKSINKDGCGAVRSLRQIQEAFVDGLVWLTTVAAVALSGVVGLVSICLTMYNIDHIPSSYFVSIRGLYFWYAVSGLLASVTLLVWGLEFLFKFSRNVGTLDSITGVMNTSGRAYLGFAYWSQLAIVVLQLSCAALLRQREKLFDSRPMFVSSLDIKWNTLPVSTL